MLTPGKMMEIADEMRRYSLKILSVQEIRWADYGKIDKKTVSFYYNGVKGKMGRKGTGFFIDKKNKGNIMSFEPIDERICKLQVKGEFNNITFINCYAPTEDREVEEKEHFYNTLIKTSKNINKYDTKMILGDFNAKLCKEPFLNEICGKNSLHEVTSLNRLQLAQKLNLRIMDTFFEHKRIHKTTWRVPGNRGSNQIDHILVDGRHFSSILDVKVCRGSN
ncbi:craniofacial development protein 2-like [Teleopsis dalmanni]|uniref:craniofacial development protein 2-like n=1 Tax=Teleopsis dalmanni TaxID=139649 RepID=UPI0018CD5094|nr:craniofacial development protein 2-like [Teleopsis dalmanni]